MRTHVIHHPDQLQRVVAYLSRLELPIEVSIGPYKTSRTAQQNRRYWALLNDISEQMPAHMDGIWHAPEMWHELFKRMFLGVEAIEIGDTTYPAVRSSRKLKIDEFAEYTLKVEAWAAEHEVYLEG